MANLRLALAHQRKGIRVRFVFSRFLGIAVLNLQLLITGNQGYAVARPAEQRGKILFLNRVVNFGNVTRGEELKYRFHFKNVGKGPLRIQGVHAACGCTVAEVSSNKAYNPGESAYIDLTFKTDNFVGSVTKAITVMTNERLAPNRTLSVRANVLAEFMADPPVVDFGEVGDATGSKRLVNVSPVGAFPLAIKGLRYNKEALDVSFKETETAHHWQVEVGLKPFKKTGFLKEAIVVKSNSKTLPHFKIVVRANLQGPIRYEPSYIEFGAISKGSFAKRLVNLQASKGFEIKKSWLEINLNGKNVANPQEYFTIIPRAKNDKEKDVEITLRNLAKRSGSIHGKLFLETTDKLQRRIVLDFYGFFL